MSFWNTSEGETLNNENVEKEYEVSSNMDPIPDGTTVTCIATEAAWSEYEGERYINVRWDVVDGDYKGRVVFHKIRVLDGDSKKRDKALRMLAAIDKNASGKLLTISNEPTDMDLASLCNQPMIIRLRVWELDDKTKSGNWVEAVGVSNNNNKQESKAGEQAKDQDGPEW